MNKLKQIFIILCILLLALVLAACTGDTPKPSDEGGETEQPGGDTPGTDDPAIPADGVFTITQDRFAAEKAALAMFDAVSGRMETREVTPSEDGNVNIEFTSDEGMIGAGSYLKMIPDGENGYKIESFAVYKEGDAPVVYAVMEGNIAIEDASWDEMPAVFLVNNRGVSVTNMISSFVSGWNPSSSARGRNLKPVYEGTQSFYNPQDGRGWIVYTDSSDGSTHKVNFNSNDTSVFTLDGWCEVGQGYEVSVSQTPAVKSEEAGMISDEEALELGTDAYAYCFSISLLYADSNNKPEWLDFGDMPPVEGVMKVTIKEHSEPDFFGKPVSVEGEMNIDMSSAVTLYTLTVDGRKIEFTAAGDPSGSSITGDIRSFSIDGINYSHLRDELYLSCIRVFTSTSNIVSLFNAINDKQGIDHWWQGVSVDGSTYTFKDSTPADWLLGHNGSGKKNRLNGKIVIDGDSFTVDMVFEEISTSDSTVLTTTEVTAEGTLTEDTKRPQFTSLKYLNHGLECNANELRSINLISSNLDMIIV